MHVEIARNSWLRESGQWETGKRARYGNGRQSPKAEGARFLWPLPRRSGSAFVARGSWRPVAAARVRVCVRVLPRSLPRSLPRCPPPGWRMAAPIPLASWAFGDPRSVSEAARRFSLQWWWRRRQTAKALLHVLLSVFCLRRRRTSLRTATSTSARHTITMVARLFATSSRTALKAAKANLALNRGLATAAPAVGKVKYVFTSTYISTGNGNHIGS